jgi:superfamily I DNA/RNA helicase
MSVVGGDGRGVDGGGVSRLDAAQAGVVMLPPDASGVVIGGPGTGKTEALVARVARLLAGDAGGDRKEPRGGGLGVDEVLVLTPTRQTATALRDRLALVGGVATPGPLARSMASFAFQLVRAVAVQRGGEPPRLLTAPDQDRIIAELLTGDERDAELGAERGVTRWPATLGPTVRASRTFRAELRTLLAECTERGIGPVQLASAGRRLGHDAWVGAAEFLTDYRFTVGAMRAEHRDPAELLREAAAILATAPAGAAGEALLGPPARLRAVLVDDAQELTRGGMAMLRGLRARGVAVLAFGDPDIGSGSFRGASPELFARLCDALGTLHVLDDQHRSTPALTRIAREVTTAIGASGRVEHRRAPGPELAPDPRVRTIIAPSPHEEIDRIARVLREWHIVDEIPWSALAVIAHDTRQVGELEAELAAREVPTRSSSLPRPLGSEGVVRNLVQLVRLGMSAPDIRDPDALSTALLSPFGGLDAVGLRRLRARLRHAELADGGTRPARELLHEAMANPLDLALLDTPEARAAERLATTLRVLHDDAQRGATVHDLLWVAWDRARDGGGRPLSRVWHELATTPGTLSAESGHALDALVALFDAAKRFVETSPDEAPEAFLRRMVDSEVPEDMLTSPDVAETVSLLTPAAALGTQFEGIVIAGVQDGVWPNVRLRGGLLDTWRLADIGGAADSGRAELGRPDASGPSSGSDATATLDRRRAALHDELRLLVRAVSRARTRLAVTAVDDDDLGPSPLLSFFPEPDEVDDPTGAAEHPLTLRGLVAQHRRALTTPAAPAPVRAHAAGQLVVLARAGVPGAAPHQWFGMAEASSNGPLRDPNRSPVHVSPSKLDAFDACGLDWAIRALGGDTRSWSAGVGTILHAAMEEVPSGDRDALQAVVDGRWGELDFEAPWMSRKEHAWAGLLVDRLHAYLERFHREEGRAVGAEARFRLAIDMDAPPGADDGEPVAPDVWAIRDDEPGPAARPGPPGDRRLALLSGSVDRIELYPPGRGEALDTAEASGAAEDGGTARVVVVDLKTGRSEHRVTDDKVADDAQLAAYQLALLEGLLPGADPAANAGARLLVLSKTLKNTHYRLARQAPMDAARRTSFLRTIIDVAEGMSSDRFDANLDTHCTTDRFAVCRIHTIKAVSAS